LSFKELEQSKLLGSQTTENQGTSGDGGNGSSSRGEDEATGRGEGGGGPEQRRGGDPGCRVYVGNLAYSVNWQMLKDFMRAAGEVVHCDIMSAPGTAMNSKGCGIVEYTCASDAKRAIKELHDSELNGRLIFVREDRGAPARCIAV